MLVIAVVAFVVFERTSAWYSSSVCGANEEASSGRSTNVKEKYCGRDGFNANTHQNSGCVRSGTTCICKADFFRQKGHGPCGPCVRHDQCKS
ncbi:hypothetical protein MTO96_039663 [Rhipicephalus appendiculatus]